MAVPTLAGGEALVACLDSLRRQSFRDARVVVIDNSGAGVVRRSGAAGADVEVIESEVNLGFGAAVNRVWRGAEAPLVATLNDDAVAAPRWLEALVEAARCYPRAAGFASCVLRAGTDRLDSAGMLLGADGSSKQRGQSRPASDFARSEEVLFPSGSAALWRRAALEETGYFDERFFLYCEDSDLGLRARWAGWECRYVADAVVEHRYSESAGRASPLKAYLVERNRLFVAVKNLPAALLVRAPWYTVRRYFWHAWAALAGRGAAGEFCGQGSSLLMLAGFVVRAHAALLANLPYLLAERRRIRRGARISPADFRRLARRHSIGPREVAWL